MSRTGRLRDRAGGARAAGAKPKGALVGRRGSRLACMISAYRASPKRPGNYLEEKDMK
jgi:hypothetical protein